MIKSGLYIEKIWLNINNMGTKTNKKLNHLNNITMFD